jgi:hypothetical protein
MAESLSGVGEDFEEGAECLVCASIAELVDGPSDEVGQVTGRHRRQPWIRCCRHSRNYRCTYRVGTSMRSSASVESNVRVHAVPGQR